VGIADMLSEHYTEYHWGKEAEIYKPISPFRVYFFERAARRLADNEKRAGAEKQKIDEGGKWQKGAATP
jgi:hypothetical protein